LQYYNHRGYIAFVEAVGGGVFDAEAVDKIWAFTVVSKFMTEFYFYFFLVLMLY
jgi:hypothetical protein